MAPGVLAVVSCLAVVVHGVGPDGAATDLDESQWFNPRLCSAEILEYMASWKGERILDAVNLFGRTRLFEQHWSSMGLTGKCLDQRIGGMSHNILTKDGWFVWLKHLLQMRDGGLVIAQAPSALWEYLSSSVHGRNSYHFGIYGDVSKWQVRRANAIARNFASLLEHIQGLRSLFFFIEQPRTSKLFALPELQYVAALLSLASYTCWTRFSQSSRIARSVVLTNLPVNVEPDASSRQPPPESRRKHRPGQNKATHSKRKVSKVTQIHHLKLKTTKPGARTEKHKVTPGALAKACAWRFMPAIPSGFEPVQVV